MIAILKRKVRGGIEKLIFQKAKTRSANTKNELGMTSRNLQMNQPELRPVKTFGR